jgi:hypothetical protein
MGAYLARKLTRLAYSPEAAFLTVHALGVAYEAKAEDGSNAPELIANDISNSYVRETQKDVAFKAAGIQAYLANQIQPDTELTQLKTEVNIDSLLSTMFDETSGKPITGRMPLLHRAALSLAVIDFDLFSARIKPDNAFEFFYPKIQK